MSGHPEMVQNSDTVPYIKLELSKIEIAENKNM